MIVDGHMHLTGANEVIEGRSAFDAPDLIRVMDLEMPVFGRPRRIDMGVVMPTPVLTTRHEVLPLDQHATVVRAVRAYPDRLVGAFILNPRHGVQAGIGALRHLVAHEGFRMVKLHPTQHGFSPNSRELVGPVMEEAVGLGIPVLIHMGEPPYAIPSLVEPMARAHPRATIILAHLATQKVSYADDALNVAQHCDNVLLETGWGPLPRLRDAARALGPSRLVFGSDTPIQEPYSQLRVVECLAWARPIGVGWSEAQVEQVLGGNMATLLRLQG